jgi:hypothetical protein
MLSELNVEYKPYCGKAEPETLPISLPDITIFLLPAAVAGFVIAIQ